MMSAHNCLHHFYPNIECNVSAWLVELHAIVCVRNGDWNCRMAVLDVTFHLTAVDSVCFASNHTNHLAHVRARWRPVSLLVRFLPLHANLHFLLFSLHFLSPRPLDITNLLSTCDIASYIPERWAQRCANAESFVVQVLAHFHSVARIPYIGVIVFGRFNQKRILSLWIANASDSLLVRIDKHFWPRRHVFPHLRI